jgi:hypothetical protein
MNSLTAPERLFSPGCPWWDLRTTWGAPNVKWCEATLCTWVNEPANAWSNVAYVAVALTCLWQWSTTRNPAQGHFAWTTLLVGVLSFAFHATNNFGTQLLDFVGMYVLIFLLLALNLHRLGWIPSSRVVPLHVGMTVGSVLLLLVLRAAGLPYQFVVLAVVLLIVGTELVLSQRAGPRRQTQDFWRAVGLMAVAAACSVADVSRRWCDPDNHWLQGHAAWHVASALALLFAARHYARVVEEARSPEPMPFLRGDLGGDR